MAWEVVGTWHCDWVSEQCTNDLMYVWLSLKASGLFSSSFVPSYKRLSCGFLTGLICLISFFHSLGI